MEGHGLSGGQLKGRRELLSPVYEVEPESGEGLHRLIHRNLLLPCNRPSF